MRSRRATVTAIASGCALALVMSAAPAGSQPPPDNPLDAARRAAERHAFTGQVLVRWRDASGEHQQLVDVRAFDGNLMVGGDALWSAGLGTLGAPRPTRKYVLTSSEGTPVAGRSTTVVEVRRGADVIERVWLDSATGLLLGREQYAVAGAPARSMTFQRIDVGAGGGNVPSPRGRGPGAAAGPRLPQVLPGDYRRLGAYKRGDLIHVVYSDGVYGLSVFEQSGRLRRTSLPAGGRRVRVGEARGWHYAWAGGHVLLWEGHDRVFSAVGDGPLTDLVQAGAAVPLGSRPSLLQRFRNACQSALRALTGRSS